MFRFGYGEITFSDGTTVSLPQQGVLVLVGPNNAGKSAALRDLVRHVHAPPGVEPLPKVVVAAATIREGTDDDLQEWLEAHAFAIDRADGRHYQRPQANVPWHAIQAEWATDQNYAPQLGQFLIFHAAADQRLGLVADAPAYDPTTEAPSHPVQVLFAREELAERLSAVAFEAFAKPLYLSRIWGAPLRLHVGEVTGDVPVPPTPTYIQAVRALPAVQEQGDGVRSFVGLMLAVITAQYPVVLVDEPEAFLHPPQARLLGRKLVSEAPERTQVVVATHDADVLQGTLDAPGADVTVVRLVRDGDVNRAAVLENTDLRGLWQDPLLRYSNVLQGLFHQGVVIGEADSDSRFYAAVLDATREREDRPPHDLLFTHSGGKQRLPTIVRALRAVEVPVAVIADFDVLREEQPLRTIIELLGGDWTTIATNLAAVQAAVSGLGSAPLLTTVKEELDAVLDNADGPRLSRDDSTAIRAASRVDDAWQQAKRGGVSALPQGEASQRAADLLGDLKGLGVFVVPVGELERWAPDIPDHGPKWVSAALEENKHNVAGSGVTTFVDEIAGFFG